MAGREPASDLHRGGAGRGGVLVVDVVTGFVVPATLAISAVAITWAICNNII